MKRGVMFLGLRPAGRVVLALGVLGLLGPSCRSGASGGGGFVQGQEPKVEFFQLDVSNRVQRILDPGSSVEAYLRIKNRSDAPIDLYKVQARLRGNIGAVTTSDVQADPQVPAQLGFVLVEQNIPSNDVRVVRFKMALTRVESPATNTGPLIPTLRGQLFFRTAKGEATLPIDAKLTDVTELQGGEEED
jgi:hypothetical protein